jgi:thioredoxin
MANVLEFTDANFGEEVIQSTEPVLVDFWAPWCGPCRMIGPVIDELVADNGGNVKIGKVNIDDNQDIALNLGVTSIPTIMIFKDGEVQERFNGIQSKERLQEAINEVS